MKIHETLLYKRMYSQPVINANSPIEDHQDPSAHIILLFHCFLTNKHIYMITWSNSVIFFCTSSEKF